MSHQEVTDRLVDIIRKIKLHAMTGLLTVRRGDGIHAEQGSGSYHFGTAMGKDAKTPSSEEGSITFQKGKMVEARIGRRSGSDAFNYLSTWGKCTFSFVYTYGHVNVNVSLTSLPDTPVSPLSTPQMPPQPSFPSEETPGRQNPIELREFQNSRPLSSGFRVPVRLKQYEQAMLIFEKLGVSRSQRQLYLLIDDQRTIKDLARLMNCEEKEIERRLEELEKIAVVYWPRGKPFNFRPPPKTEK